MMQEQLQPTEIDYPSRKAAASALADEAVAALNADLEVQGTASLLCSGGSTPGQFFATLAERELDWSRICVGLVDDRYVPPSHAASNEGLIRSTLLQGPASKAEFVPMWKDDVPAEIAAKVASVAYESLLPASFILLGMGNDGHTASWFPDARNLADAFAPAADNVVAIDATGCPVAGEFVSRLTISNAALKGTRSAALLLHGADKKETLRRAMTEDVLQAPIRAAMATLGDRLKIAWAP